MRWPWSRKPTPPPRIQPYKVPVETKAPKPKDDGIEVKELDAAAMDPEALAALRKAQSETGMHRAWRRLTGRGDDTN